MDERPVCNNRNPCYDNCNHNRDNNDNDDGPPPTLNLNQADLMTFVITLATTFKG